MLVELASGHFSCSNIWCSRDSESFSSRVTWAVEYQFSGLKKLHLFFEIRVDMKWFFHPFFSVLEGNFLNGIEKILISKFTEEMSHSIVIMTIVEFVQKNRRIEISPGLWKGGFYCHRWLIEHGQYLPGLFCCNQKFIYIAFFGKMFVIFSRFQQCLGSPGVRSLDAAPSVVENFKRDR